MTSRMLWALAVVVAASLFAGVGAGFADIPPPPDRDQRVCPMIYQPVCGGDGRTYSNRCVAEGQGARVAYDGQCRSHPSRACPRIYRPVCGRNGVSYANRCLAEVAGVRVRYEGRCRRPQDDICARVRCPGGTVCENGACRAIEPPAPSNRRCGGFAGLRCPANEECYIRERYPDAMGVCRPAR